MNPKRLRAGKAVDETGKPSPLPGRSNPTNLPPQAGQRKVVPPVPVPPKPKIPQILFEDDEFSKPTERTLAQKFYLGGDRTESLGPEKAQLPEAYGTGKLLLSARDPHSVFAHWDLTKEEQRHYGSASADGHLTLRAYAHAFSNQPAVEVPVGPEARHLFLQVERAGTSYVGELGYYQPDRKWRTVATSAPATTPPDAPSKKTSVVFSTPQARRSIPAIIPQGIEAPPEPAETSIIPVSTPPWPFESDWPTEGEQVSATGPRLHQQHLPDDAPPFVKRGARKEWTPVQERLLAEMIRISLERREWISSAEIPWPDLPAALVNISSPMGEEQPGRKGFWFNINAELIVYGATEPNAQVTIGGRPIKLRPDGTFTCQFALPDGDYALAAAAVSPENELRQAGMNFSRHTTYSGEVGAHPQNPSLERIPQPE